MHDEVWAMGIMGPLFNVYHMVYQVHIHDTVHATYICSIANAIGSSADILFTVYSVYTYCRDETTEQSRVTSG